MFITCLGYVIPKVRYLRGSNLSQAFLELVMSQKISTVWDELHDTRTESSSFTSLMP